MRLRIGHHIGRHSRGDVGVVNLADDGPLAFDFQKIEEISEAKAGNVVGVDAGAGSHADNVDVDDYALCLRRGAKRTIDGIEKALNGPACQLVVTIDTEDRGVSAKSWLHEAAVGLFATLVVLIEYVDDRLVFLHVDRFVHGVAPG